MWSRRGTLLSSQLLLLGLATALTAALSEEGRAPSAEDVANETIYQSWGQSEVVRKAKDASGQPDAASSRPKKGEALEGENDALPQEPVSPQNEFSAAASREAANSAEALAAGHASAEALESAGTESNSVEKIPRLVRRPYSATKGGYLKTPQSFMQRKFDAEGNPIPLTEEQLEAEIDRLFEMAPEEVDKQTAAIARSVDASRSAQNPIGRIIIAVAGEDETAERSQADRNAVTASVKEALQEEQLQRLNLIEEVKVLPELGLAVMNFSPDATEAQIRETVKTVWAKTPEAWLIEADSVVDMRADQTRQPFPSSPASVEASSSASPASPVQPAREASSSRRERRERNRERQSRAVGQQVQTEVSSSESRASARQQRREAQEERRHERQQRQRHRASRLEALSLDGEASSVDDPEGPVAASLNGSYPFGSGYLNLLQKQTELFEEHQAGEHLFAQLKNHAKASQEGPSAAKALRASEILEGAESSHLLPKPKVASYEQMSAGLRRLAAESEKAEADGGEKDQEKEEGGDKKENDAKGQEEEGGDEDDDDADVEEGVDEDGLGWRVAFFSETSQQPNDALYAQQWGLNHSDYGCKATNAWRLVYSRGKVERGTLEAQRQARATALKQEMLVAVIDTGIDYRHPDLQRSLWKNVREIPENGIDDDGNGYVDDYHGYDFEGGSPDPSDRHGHGTHVAGILAAAANNRIGVAGVNWRVKMMPLKFERRASAAVEAINYSLQMGARMSTNSWGFTTESEALKLALEKAEKAGQLFVAAVDNAGRNNSHNGDFPPNWGVDVRSGKGLTNILRVANLARSGRLAYTSNFGAFNVDLAAPGTDILSTVPSRGRETYGFKSGTSMATPLVAGVAAMVWSTRPSLTASEVRHLLMYSATPVAELREKVLSGGTVNAEAAVRLAMALNARDEGVESEVAEAFEAYLRKSPAAQQEELQSKAQAASSPVSAAETETVASEGSEGKDGSASPPALQSPGEETASTTTPPQGSTSAGTAKQPRRPGRPAVLVVPPRPKTGGGTNSPDASGGSSQDALLFKLPTSPSADGASEAPGTSASAASLPGSALLGFLELLRPLGIFDFLGL